MTDSQHLVMAPAESSQPQIGLISLNFGRSEPPCSLKIVPIKMPVSYLANLYMHYTFYNFLLISLEDYWLVDLAVCTVYEILKVF